jgi:hypothetical protein
VWEGECYLCEFSEKYYGILAKEFISSMFGFYEFCHPAERVLREPLFHPLKQGGKAPLHSVTMR